MNEGEKFSHVIGIENHDGMASSTTRMIDAFTRFHIFNMKRVKKGAEEFLRFENERL